MLFKDSNKLQEYVSVASMPHFNSLRITLAQVEDAHILPILGTEQYNDLNTAFTQAASEASLSNAQKALLDVCRRAIGPLFLYQYAPIAEVSLTETGIRRQETETMKSAFQYQTANFRTANLLAGEAALENLIRFLEEHKTDYPKWVAGNGYKSHRSRFIKSGSEFNDYFHTHSPFRNFFAMRSVMQDVEELIIRPFLGNETFDALKAIDADDQNFSEKQNALLFYIKKAIAAFTIVQAVPRLNVRMDTGGITVSASEARSSNDNITSRSQATAAAINHFIENAESAGKGWIEKAAQYMISNKSDFPDFPGNVSSNNPVTNTSNTFGLI